jgi:hypothetical protein
MDRTEQELLLRVTVVLERVERLLEDHEKRLRTTEKWMYAAPATLLLAILSLTFSFLR